MSLANLGRLLRLALGQAVQPEPSSSIQPPDTLLDFAFIESDEALQPGAMADYLTWMLGVDGDVPPPPLLAAYQLLAAADREIHAKGCSTRLLRRSPAVLPRLIRLLRTETYSTAELARQIEQDIVLTAEVLRMARSALYAHLEGASLDVRMAVGVLGSTGVEQVLARVLLRPLYRSDGSALQARSATRLWEESERCATACVLLARREGVDTFDAYVAGLLQNAGWSALLRIFEIHGIEAALHPDVLTDAGHREALLDRRDQLLARLIPAWELSGRLTAMARAMTSDAPHPERQLADLVSRAQEQVMRRRLAELHVERDQAASSQGPSTASLASATAVVHN